MIPDALGHGHLLGDLFRHREGAAQGLALKFVAAFGRPGQKCRPRLRRQILHRRGRRLLRRRCGRCFRFRRSGRGVRLRRHGGCGRRGGNGFLGLRGTGCQQEQGQDQNYNAFHRLPPPGFPVQLLNTVHRHAGARRKANMSPSIYYHRQRRRCFATGPAKKGSGTCCIPLFFVSSLSREKPRRCVHGLYPIFCHTRISGRRLGAGTAQNPGGRRRIPPGRCL